MGGAAQAIPILWTLQDLVLDDGGTASGNFVFDADANTHISINIATFAGSVCAT